MAAASAALRKAQSFKKRDTHYDLQDAHVNTVFQRYDLDGSGDLNLRELRKALKDLGVLASVDQASALMQKYDSNDDGELNNREFAHLVHDIHTLNRRGSVGTRARPESRGRSSLPFQDAVQHFYVSRPVAWTFAFFILANFFVNVVEKEIDPAGVLYQGLFLNLDTVFTVIFLIELLINMYGCGGPHRQAFWKSGWNLFDTLIVAVGVIILSGVGLGRFRKLKLLRAFRVLRLGKRITSLNKSKA
jgi:hypothetical protein